LRTKLNRVRELRNSGAQKTFWTIGMQRGIGWPAMSRRQETDLEKARRHVREGELRLARQCAVVTQLGLAGDEAGAMFAKWLLEAIQGGLELQRRHLRYIESQLKK
jgi:hypothetical protein